MDGHTQTKRPARRLATAVDQGAGTPRRGPGYKVWYVPPDLHAEIKRLAREQGRTIIGQVSWMMQDAVRREAEHARRSQDNKQGAA